MKIGDDILKGVLERKIEQIKQYPKSAQKEVEAYMAQVYGVKFGTTVDIFNGRLPIDSLSYDMLYKLMMSIKVALADRWMNIDLSELNADVYFNEKEQEEFMRPLAKKAQDTDLIFNEVLQLGYDRFETKTTADELYRWININKVGYNPDTQRDLIEVTTNTGTIYKKIDINKKSIKEMYDLIEKGDFICQNIIFNINPDINESADLMPKIYNGKLIISKDAKIDTADGWHRLQAICLYKAAHPEWDAEFGIEFVAYNTSKMNQFIYLQDKKNHLSDKQTKRINRNDEANYIVDRLSDESNFHLRKSITKELKSELSIIITSVFAPKDRNQSFIIYKDIFSNMNKLVEEKMLFDATLSKEEWFIYLFLIKEYKNRFIELIDLIDIDEIKEIIKYKKKPSINSYKTLNSIVKEVLKNE